MKRSILTVFLASGCILALTICAVAGSWVNAKAAYYRSGYGAHARRLLLPFARRGSAEAQSMVGDTYMGTGSLRNDAKALAWHRKAANQGFAPAQVDLGYAYRTGVPKDDAIAFSWFSKAAAQGNEAGQEALAYCYEDGTGVKPDLVKAWFWYNLNGPDETTGECSFMMSCQQEVSAKMTPEQISQAQKFLADWKAKH